MQHFRNISITRKLLLIAALTNVLALLIAASAYISFERVAARQEMVRMLSVLADAVGLHGAAPLSFRDETTARETLAGLKADPHVMNGTLFEKNGAVFATYSRDAGLPLVTAPPEQEVVFRNDSVLLTRPVMLNGKRIGTVCVESDLELLRERLLLIGGIVAATMVLALVVTMVFTLVMQRSISRPILTLASTARSISERKDYSARAELSAGSDEIGRLATAFNQMLESIQEREAALRLNEQRLEALVKLNQMTAATPQQLTDFALEEGVRLTRSASGYLAFLNEAGEVTALHRWPHTGGEPGPAGAGLWRTVITQRKPVVINEVTADSTDAPPYPFSAAQLRRHMNIPLFDGERIVAVAGANNKDIVYDESDVQQTTLLLQGMWRLTQRRYAEDELIKHRDHLEDLVAERAADLKKANEQLLGEVAGRRRAIEELQQAENKYRTLLQSTDQGIYGVDRESHCIFINRSAAQLLGYEPEEILGRNTHDLVHHTRPDGSACPYDACPICVTLHTGKGTRTDSELFWRREGTSFPVEFSSHPILQGGNVIGAVVAFNDITQRRQAEKQLQEIATALERSNKELEQFAYVASHDLQEPLRMVASYVQLLARRYKDKLDADANDFINFAVDGAKRMQTLINDLLTYSRVGTRAKLLTATDCELVLQDALNNLQVAILESGAIITHDTLPVVLGDSVQLSQLFQNLLSNAIKFRHRGEAPSIHVGAERRAAEWVLSVHDNGIGIDLRHADRIFQIFQRLHTRDEYPGTGIGLAVCKKIVERHGGRIWAESQPGHGATFLFTFPATAEVVA
jgi:PAS domain S-box-containing protein